MRDDPCFRCVLPDCDDASPRCTVRRLANRVRALNKARRHDQIAPIERLAANEAFRIWEINRAADRSEGRA